MTTFVFANMTVSGIKVMTSEPIDRRERFILAVSASFGLGTILVPQLFTSNFLNCAEIDSPGVQGLCNAAVITLSTGYAAGCLVALVLNAVIPDDDEDDVVVEGDDTAPTQASRKLLNDEEQGEPSENESEEKEDSGSGHGEA